MTLISLAQLVAALGCALIAGTFFIFSVCVMRSLASRPVAEAIAVMQAINRIIVRTLFLPVFLGTALLCAGLGVYAVIMWEPRIFAASLLYVIGTFGVTMAANVPRNNVLDRADPSAADSPELWARYLREWTFWNHVRTIASTIATVLFAMG